VEGDLPAAEVERLDRHLVGCESCRSFLRELNASQSVLKALAVELLPQEALSAVRERVLAETSRGVPRGRGLPAWLLAAAAVLIVAAGLMALSRTRPLIPDRSIATRTVPSLPSATRSPQASGRLPSTRDVAPPVVPSPTRPESTARAKRPVSPVPAAAQTLTPAEADQLARALVAVAEVESLADVQDGAEAMGAGAIADREASSAFMRWTTKDPDVVIYWQLETNGGE
jgi:hypothetical protein